MNLLRAALATAVLVLCADFGDVSAAVISVQYRSQPGQGDPAPVTEQQKAQATEQKTPATEQKAPAAEQKAPVAEREPRAKERTPPPRPIVPPEGQQQNPALREECAWLGQRIVSLLFRDDPMTGNDFTPFYEHFGCPTEHLSKAFGCVVSSGNAENDVLADRIAACWTDPTKRPMPPAADQEKKASEPAPAVPKPANGSK